MGFPSGQDHIEGYELDDAAVQDRIIVESFEPVLDLLLKHPTWKLTLEMQGYMVEVMQARHAAILAKLKQLVEGGQVELVSFHWSDQLFLAYPRLDLERSHQLLDQVMARAGLTPSEVVFCQEGQFGEGMAKFAKAHNRSILGLPKNLFRYQHQSEYDSAPPLYKLDGADVVLIGRGLDTPQVQVNWNFFDDGELMATNGLDPYLGTSFRLIQSAVDAYEDKLTDLESRGYRIATITEYVNWAKAKGLAQPTLPAVLDGTWQPRSTDSMRRWMGATGLFDIAYQCERDNSVLTGNVQARHRVLTAETLVGEAEARGLIAAGAYANQLTTCWRAALLGQVTDASGLNPFINEVRYALEHGQFAQYCAGSIIAEVAPRFGGPWLEVNNRDRTVMVTSTLPREPVSERAPFFTSADGFKVTAPGREVQLTWHDVGSEGTLHRLAITASAPTTGERTLEVIFPMELDAYRLTPGLVDDAVKVYPIAGFSFEEGRISIPAANGLIGLKDNLWLIKQTNKVHMAATFHVGEPTVGFRDESLSPMGAVTWVFWLFEGDETAALELAGLLNLHPLVYIDTSTVSSGCNCSSGGPGAGFPQGGTAILALLMVLFLLIRRRRGPY